MSAMTLEQYNAAVASAPMMQRIRAGIANYESATGQSFGALAPVDQLAIIEAAALSPDCASVSMAGRRSA